MSLTDNVLGELTAEEKEHLWCAIYDSIRYAEDNDYIEAEDHIKALESVKVWLGLKETE